MRSIPRLVFFIYAAACWLAAGPGDVTTRALLACRHHHAAHHAAGGHHTLPSGGPCFCDQMTGGLDLAVSTAVPTPATPGLTLVAPAAQPAYPSRFPLPPSPAFTPVPPPPNELG